MWYRIRFILEINMYTKQKIRFVVILALFLILSVSSTTSSAQNSLQIILGTTERVSVSSDGIQGNADSNYSSISADGRQVAFETASTNLVVGDTNDSFDVFIHDRVSGETTRVSVASDGTQGNDSSFWPSISADGRYVAFSSYASNLVDGDTNGWEDIFVHDLLMGETTKISVASDET
jgi:Tol biopolymer transport system component